ncbi:MAG TPA: ATP cone domain-containing protein, partial [Thermoleophilia bacterium]|nr:ATP cone domain-containing protein [Thermoleophilia bacterium]
MEESRPERKEQTPVVYLSGPLSGCNREQRHNWRSAVQNLSPHFEYIDPTEWGDDYDFSRQLKALDDADIVVANMWKVSVGTTMDIWNARYRGKPIVLVDPNYLRNPILEELVRPVEPAASLEEACRRLEELASRPNPLRVQKKDETLEEFEFAKLRRSLEFVCAEANVNDINLPQQLAALAVDRLRDWAAAGVVSTEQIDKATIRSLDEVGRNRINQKDVRVRVEAIRAAIKRREESKESALALAEVQGDKDKLVALVEWQEAELNHLRAEKALLKQQQELEEAPGYQPKTVVEALERAAEQFDDSLQVHPKAWRSARKANTYQPLRVLLALETLGKRARERMAELGDGAPAGGLAEFFDKERPKVGAWLH